MLPMVDKKQPKPQLKNSGQQAPGYDLIYTIGRAAEMLESTERTLAEKFRTGEIAGYKKLGR